MRWLRVVAYTGPALGTAIVGHAAAQGCVSVQGVAEASITCLAAGGMLLRGERTRGQLTSWLVACQLMTHLLLQLHCPPGERNALLAHDGRLLFAHLLAMGLAGAMLAPAERALWAASRLGPAVRRAAERCLRPSAPVLVPPVLRR